LSQACIAGGRLAAAATAAAGVCHVVLKKEPLPIAVWVPASDEWHRTNAMLACHRRRQMLT
jgi:hypothetical protein